MLSKALPLLALIYGASTKPQHLNKTLTDEECFHAAFPNYTTTIKNSSTFDIRIEHTGSIFNVGDWFDSGDVHTIKQGEVYKYNTTAKAMGEICEVVDVFDGDWCEGAMNKIGDMVRYLVVGFDGEQLFAAMNKMVVNVTTDDAPWEWSGCDNKTMKAVQDMNVEEFIYVDWDTSSVTEGSDFPEWSPKDKLLLSGTSSTIASIVTLFVSLLVSTRLF